MLSLIILLEKFEFPQSCKVIQSYLQWISHFNSLTSCKVKISAQLSRFNYILQRALTITRISPSGMSVLLLVNFYPKVEIETSESYYSSFFFKAGTNSRCEFILLDSKSKVPHSAQKTIEKCLEQLKSDRFHSLTQFNSIRGYSWCFITPFTTS